MDVPSLFQTDGHDYDSMESPQRKKLKSNDDSYQQEMSILIFFRSSTTSSEFFDDITDCLQFFGASGSVGVVVLVNNVDKSAKFHINVLTSPQDMWVDINGNRWTPLGSSTVGKTVVFSCRRPITDYFSIPGLSEVCVLFHKEFDNHRQQRLWVRNVFHSKNEAIVEITQKLCNGYSVGFVCIQYRGDKKSLQEQYDVEGWDLEECKEVKGTRTWLS